MQKNIELTNAILHPIYWKMVSHVSFKFFNSHLLLSGRPEVFTWNPTRSDPTEAETRQTRTSSGRVQKSGCPKIRAARTSLRHFLFRIYEPQYYICHQPLLNVDFKDFSLAPLAKFRLETKLETKNDFWQAENEQEHPQSHNLNAFTNNLSTIICWLWLYRWRFDSSNNLGTEYSL